MVIKFLCPNNHPLTAPENLAGKAGKCPKCNTPFRVPVPEEPLATPPEPVEEPPLESGELVDEPEEVPTSEAAGTGSGMAMGSAPQQAGGEIFVFLCPNGHKLNGPPSLKGKAGQCPHCGERFRIPADDDPMLEDVEEVGPDSVEEGYAEDSPSGENAFPFLNFGNDAPEDEPVEETYEIPEPDPFPPDANAMSYIMGRLWDQKTDETELDVFLVEGEIMSPEHYSEHLSSREYGVFAIRESDGTFAVTVIPWSAVRRVGMRKIGELPPQYFR